MQFYEKLMIQTQENCEKPHFGPDLGRLGPNLGRQFLSWSAVMCNIRKN